MKINNQLSPILRIVRSILLPFLELIKSLCWTTTILKNPFLELQIILGAINWLTILKWIFQLLLSRSKKVDLTYFIFPFIFYFIFYLFLFSIFRTTSVRVDRSRHHISHLIAKSQDRSQDLGEFSRRFKNKMTSYNIDTTCWPHELHMVV